jgi:hypothetical protein
MPAGRQHHSRPQQELRDGCAAENFVLRKKLAHFRAYAHNLQQKVGAYDPLALKNAKRLCEYPFA